jgi:hypothetical protein
MIHWGMKKHKLDLNNLVTELGFNLVDLQKEIQMDMLFHLKN